MVSHECGVIYIDVPFSGGKSFEEFYIKKHNQLFVKNKEDINKYTAKCIREFFDYDIFAIVKNPYHRAVDMWLSAQSKYKKTNVKKQTIGEYYENLLNGWDCADGDALIFQTTYLKSKNGYYLETKDIDFECSNIFYYEELIDSKLDKINDFLSSNNMPNLSFFLDTSSNENWREYYDTQSIEIINYIFDEDFDYCGYRKI